MEFEKEECGFCHERLVPIANARGYNCRKCLITCESGETFSKFKTNYPWSTTIIIRDYQIDFSWAGSNNPYYTFISQIILSDVKFDGRYYLIAPTRAQFNFLIDFDLSDETKCLERIKTLLNFQ